MTLAQLTFVPDPPAGANLSTYIAPAAQGQCDDGPFDTDKCSGNEIKIEKPQGLKQPQATLSPNITEIVSCFS